MLQQTGFQMVLFMGSLVLFSWPFWSAPENRGIGFVFAYFFGAWALLVLLLLIFRPRPSQKDSKK